MSAVESHEAGSSQDLRDKLLDLILLLPDARILTEDKCIPSDYRQLSRL